MLEIVPYKRSWPSEFRKLASLLRQGLGDLALRIDHIGSTAVPGLAAKDVIDIQITVAALDQGCLVRHAGSRLLPARRYLGRSPSRLHRRARNRMGKVVVQPSTRSASHPYPRTAFWGEPINAMRSCFGIICVRTRPLPRPTRS